MIVLSNGFAVAPLASAIAKAFPLFSLKTSPDNKQQSVHVVFATNDGTVIEERLAMEFALLMRLHEYDERIGMPFLQMPPCGVAPEESEVAHGFC